jgi:hypothetical protein
MTIKYTKGKITKGATEYGCLCADCGAQDWMHAHSGIKEAVAYFIREKWMKILNKWYCPTCSLKFCKEAFPTSATAE